MPFMYRIQDVKPPLQIARTTLKRMLPARLQSVLKHRVLGRPPICPQVRAWAESTGLAEVVKIHEEMHQRSRPLPPADDQPMPEIFTQNQTYPIYAKVLHRIPQVRIRGKSGTLTLPDGSVCHQNAWALEHITGSPDYSTRWRGPVVQKKGNYVTLIFYWGLCYYHWFNDVLCTLYQNLELYPEDTRFIIPSDAQPHHLAALDLLGIGPEKRLPFDGSEVWVLENLWFQPPAAHPEDHTPGALTWLGRTLSAAVLPSSTEKPVRLFISRRTAAGRSVDNEEDLVSLLAKHGFIRIACEKLSLPDQIRLFRQAEAIVAPHGSGLLNSIYSPPGTPVLELFSAGDIRRHYWGLAHEMRLSYRFLVGEPVLGRGPEPDIQVNLARVEAWIESVLGGTPAGSRS